jgi:hypothetical protein
LCRLRFLLLRFPAFTREPQAAWHRRLRGTLGKDSPNSPSRDTLGTQQMIERNRLTREPAGTKVLGERTQHRCTPDSLLLHRGSLTPETKLKLGSDRTSPLGRPGAAIEVPDRQQPRFPATFYGRTNRCIGVHFHPNRPYFRCAFSGISNLEAVPAAFARFRIRGRAPFGHNMGLSLENVKIWPFSRTRPSDGQSVSRQKRPDSSRYAERHEHCSAAGNDHHNSRFRPPPFSGPSPALARWLR